jgi:hypothetical protein
MNRLRLSCSICVDNFLALGWTQKMLSIQPGSRPTAPSLVTSITASDKGEDTVFCGICCVPDEDDFQT